MRVDVGNGETNTTNVEDVMIKVSWWSNHVYVTSFY